MGIPTPAHNNYLEFTWEPFTVDDVLKQVSDIKIYKSSGLPLIASKIWKIVFKSFAPILCHIFNCSLDS